MFDVLFLVMSVSLATIVALLITVCIRSDKEKRLRNIIRCQHKQLMKFRGYNTEGYNWHTCHSKIKSDLLIKWNMIDINPASEKVYLAWSEMPPLKTTQYHWFSKFMTALLELAEHNTEEKFKLCPVEGEIEFDSEGGFKTR